VVGKRSSSLSVSVSRLNSVRKTKSLYFNRYLQTTSSLKSPEAPSFSSHSHYDMRLLETRLGLGKVANVVVNGVPNREFPKDYEVDLNSWTMGALEAVSSVTKSIANKEWDKLDGLVENQCIDSLRSKVEGLSSDKLQYVAVEPQNVFFTFISNPEDCENGRNLNLVTFSFPRLNEIKSRYFECKSITKATKKKMNAIKEEGAMNNLKREEIQQLLKRNFESYKEELQYIDPTNMFKDNEILIGNYRFIKDSQSQWVLREISHINSQEAWPKIFRMRWKFRLGVSLKLEKNFNTILRADYGLDIFALMTSALLTVLAASLGLVEP